MIAVAAQLEEQLTDVCLRRHEDEQNGLGGHGGEDRHASAILEDGGEQLRMLERATQFVGGSDDGRNEGRDALWIEGRSRLAVDEQSIATKYDSRFDTFALPNRSHELPNAGQLDASRKVTAKLEIGNVEVKH